MKALVTQLLRFAAVGGVGFVVDVAIFNILRVTILSPESLHEGPVLAKVVSTSIAIVVNWLGNRYWTFGPHRRPQAMREGIEFALVSVGGMLIGLACLWVSHYVLGYTSLLADNVSSNVIGLALGTVFRFWLYRAWVFAPVRRLPYGDRGSTEGAVVPSGFAPLQRIQAVATVEDRSTGNQ